MMPSVKRVEDSEETFTPGSAGPVHPIAQDKSKGLTTLPSELLLEIVAHFPDPLVEPQYFPIDRRQQFADLRALSQTCKGLHSAVLPLAWESLEVYTGHLPTSYVEQTRIGSALERMCKGLLQSPHLIPYVRILTISLVNYQVTTILPTFVECLQALTNLHTIQIVYTDDNIEIPIKNAFKGRIFPSVKTMVLPYAARNILGRCPNVEHLTCSDDDDPWYGLFTARKFCDAVVAAKLTTLKTLRRVMPSEDMMKGMAKSAPNLELIRLFCDEDENPNLQELHNFKNLDTIEIQFSIALCYEENQIILDQLRTSQVQIAQEVLKASKSTKEKNIKLLYSRLE